MEHDIYYERQRALIERAQQAEREREEFEQTMRYYRREKASREAYSRIQGTKRYRIVREGKAQRPQKKAHATFTKSERQVYRTHRFPNSHITVYCKGSAMC